MQKTNHFFVLPTIAGTIVAMVIAGMMDMRPGDIIFAGLLGALAMQLWRLRQQVEELQDQFSNINTESKPLVTPRSTTQYGVAHSSSSAPVATASTAIMPSATISSTDLSDRPASAPRRIYVPPPPNAFELQLQSFWNWLKTRNPIALAAVTISFLGGVFLVKYAAEHSHFPIEYRFIALSIVTLGAIITGWRIHARNNAQQVFAQIMQGGGIAGLYLTIFAATRLYSLLPAEFALTLMVGVAVAAALLAVAQGALPLAIIGTAGGFLTPILISTGSSNHVALFTYYAILNMGVFTVAWFRTWRVLNVLSFAFTFSITALWRGNAYHQEDWWSTDLFLLLYFLMFVGISILNALRQPPNLKGYVSGSLVFGLPVAAFSLHASLVQTFPYALAYSALGLAIFYCVLALTLRRQSNTNFKLLIEAFAALAVIFASLAIPLAFNRHATAAMWSFEGAGMIWLGLRTQRKLPRFFGMLLQISAGCSYLYALTFSNDLHHSLWPFINGEYIGSVLLCGTAWFSAWLLHLHKREHTDQPLASYEKNWAVIALWVGCGWWLLGGLHEGVNVRLHDIQIAAILIHAVIGAAILWFASQRWSWQHPAAIALCAPSFGVLLALINLDQIATPHPFVCWGILGWPILFVGQYALLWLCDRKAQNKGMTLLCDRLHTATYLLLAFINSWEGYWQISHRLLGTWPVLITGLIPALLLWTLSYAPEHSPMTNQWPVNQHRTAYRIHAGVALAIYILLWLFDINITRAGDPVYIPYIPLLNPLDITSLLLFFTVAKWWRSLDTQKPAWISMHIKPVVVMALLFFVWMNAAVIRTLHYEFDVPLNAHSLFESTLVQTTLSIFWMLLSLAAMLYASHRKKRTLWLTGAILMTIVIAKLLLIDLVHTGTLARIVSFLSVGGLLFVISYLSPLPPSSDAEISTE